MRHRLAGLGVEGVQARTFHSAALRQLRYFWPRVVGGAPPEILPHKARVLGPVLSRARPAATPACCATSPPRSSGPRRAR